MGEDWSEAAPAFLALLQHPPMRIQLPGTRPGALWDHSPHSHGRPTRAESMAHHQLTLDLLGLGRVSGTCLLTASPASWSWGSLALWGCWREALRAGARSCPTNVVAKGSFETLSGWRGEVFGCPALWPGEDPPPHSYGHTSQVSPATPNPKARKLAPEVHPSVVQALSGCFLGGQADERSPGREMQ